MSIRRSHQNAMRRRFTRQHPVLFLDFDGVLHPAGVQWVGEDIVLARSDVALFEWAPLLVEALAPFPQVQVVLSTSWVRVLGFDEASQRLPEGLRSRIVDATWFAHSGRGWDLLTRYEQVHYYVRRHDCRRWVALDDDVAHWGAAHRANLVATIAAEGLAAPGKLDELAQKLVKLVEH